MFGTFIEKLESLLGKTFLISSLFPLVLGISINALLIVYRTRQFTDGHELLTSIVSWISKPTVDIVVLALIACLAYLLSPLNLPMREFLEGKYLPILLSERLQANQYKNLVRLSNNLEETARRHHWLAIKAKKWGASMRKARCLGKQINACNYDESGGCARTMRKLNRLRLRRKQIPREDLIDASVRLFNKLRLNNVDLNRSYSCQALDKAEADFFEAVKYSLSHVQQQYRELYDDRQFNYPEGYLAPTLMGNIARSIAAYADRRYRFSMDIFWTKLQRVVQEDVKYYRVLQDAKTQLDFLTALIWVAAVSSIGWTIDGLLQSYGNARLSWLLNPGIVETIIAICAGFVAVQLLYRLTLQNYRAFADLLRSCVDLYRFGLLQLMHVPLPKDIEQERQLWETLTRMTGFGEVQAELTYVHPLEKEKPMAPASK